MIQEELVIKNIEGAWDKCEEVHKQKGKEWYNTAREWCNALSTETKVPIVKVVGVFSALSPQASYKHNRNICELYFKGIHKHTKTQIEKCNRILLVNGVNEQEKVEEIGNILGGLKTKNFFKCIYDPENSDYVCLDRHAIHIADIQKNSLTEKQYEFIANCYKKTSIRIGVKPLVLQAITWVGHRAIKYPNHKYD